MRGKMRQDLYAEMFRVEDTHWWHAHKRAVVRQFLKLYANRGKILDVGAGTGKILAELKTEGWQVLGLDGEPEAIIWSAKRGVEVKRLDLHKKVFPLADHSFEAVIALDLLEHVPNDREVLTEMNRVLKPGGVGVITVPAYQWLFNYWDRILGHQRRYTTGRLAKTCRQSGFEILFQSYYVSLALLPALFVRFLKAKSRPMAQEVISDFQTTPLAVISVPVLKLYFKIERWLLKYLSLPFGLSVVMVIQKPIKKSKRSKKYE